MFERDLDIFDPYSFHIQPARQRIKCKSGLVMSVQASENHYCTPRVSGWNQKYSEVEIGFPTEVIEELLPYAEDPDDPTNTVYAYVPVIIVCKIIANHGNIDDGEIPKMTVTPPANRPILHAKHWKLDEYAKQNSKD